MTRVGPPLLSGPRARRLGRRRRSSRWQCPEITLGLPDVGSGRRMKYVAGVVEVQADVVPFGDAVDAMPRSRGERCDAGALFVEFVHPDSLAIGADRRRP